MTGRVRGLLAGTAVVALFAVAFGPAAFGAAYTVETAAVTIKGMSEKALTDEKGMTLYYVNSDTPSSSSCTGGCAQIWPPLLSTSAPTSEDKLPGKLSVVKTANGSQVAYQGHLLYRYSGDSAAGQANGQGVAGKWWVAKLDLKPAMSSGSTQPSNGGDYGKGGY